MKTIDLNTNLVPQFRANTDEIKKYLSENTKQKFLIFSSSNDLKEELLGEFPDLQFSDKSFLDRGFSFDDFIIFTDYELLAKKINTQQKRKDYSVPKDFTPISLDSIRPGDCLVHLKHGIGKYLGLKEFEIDQKKKEYIALEYHNNETLNIPVEQMNLLSLYKGSETPKISRLGGTDWDRAKTNVRNAVKKVVEGLIELYATRSIKNGFTFEIDTPWQQEMEDAFPYKETPDQAKATTEIKQDMESGQIMDRVLCGDVGFGKTEVMIRAAFKAVMSGKQVAVLAPTTILAQQHYRSFRERLENFPAKLGLLTRSTVDKIELQNNLLQGELDIVIGTHALLNDKFRYKDLGLLIIDEEQKFGVSHKEKLKKLRADIAVLTVSATPIPRTLHMALSGIREMSLISTPPPGRVPIKTQLHKENPQIIRSAILRELERGGQIFYLHNRVETIEQKAVELMQLVPEASFRIGYGTMPPAQIESVMGDFMNHEFDVLVATSIIENGIDIPNANTMIIEDSNKFGLSQLYQLRGRVGRSNDPSRPGYALLLYKQIDNLTETAQARLETITRYSGLGVGYQIALKDMEIRGVGNLLGADQHGKVVSIGFDLYCEMLNDAIQKLKSGQSIDEALNSFEEKPIIEFKIPASIPHIWIANETERIREYKRLSEVKSILQLEALMEEWKDRFSENIPTSVLNLFKISKLRLLAENAGVFGSIKPKAQLIELNTKLNLLEWQDLYTRVQPSLKSRLTVRFLKEPYAVVILKVTELGIEKQIDSLIEIFQCLSKIRNSSIYKNNFHYVQLY